MPPFDHPIQQLLSATELTPSESARRIADRAPLVHFPARTPLMSWAHWKGLSSPKQRCEQDDNARPFATECWQYVYFYVGASCYRTRREEAHGDAVALFANDALDRARGFASPFDTGAWLRQPPLLQPNASANLPEHEDARAQQLRSNMSVALASWREVFTRWLSYCYRDPQRYLHATGDRYSDGEPDQTVPAELLEHNGARGRTRYPPRPGEKPHHYQCCDRRAWTWELRCEDEVSFAHITHVVALRSSEQQADEFCNELFQQHQREVIPIIAERDNDTQSEQALYLRAAQQAQSLVNS